MAYASPSDFLHLAEARGLRLGSQRCVDGGAIITYLLHDMTQTVTETDHNISLLNAHHGSGMRLRRAEGK